MILVFLLFYFYYNIIKVRVRIMNALKETKKKHTTGIAIGAAAVVIFALLVVFMRKRM